MNRFGNVRELPSGRYQARYRPRRGSQVKAPETFDTEREARQWLQDLEADQKADDGAK